MTLPIYSTRENDNPASGTGSWLLIDKKMDPFSKRMIKNAGHTPVSKGRGPVVLMYHSLSNGRDQWSLSARLFRSHLVLLAKEGWHTARVHELNTADSLPEKTAVITFDDGFADNFEHGFKILEKLKMSATWFVVTGRIGKSSDWTADRMNKTILNKRQLHLMKEAGMEIGSHTRTHTDLSRADRDTLLSEIRDSKSELEDIIGSHVASFAYPYGRYNIEVKRAVLDAGYQTACSVRPGWAGSSRDLLSIRRVSVFCGDTSSVLARKLAFAANDVSWPRMAGYAAKRIKQRISGYERTGP